MERPTKPTYGQKEEDFIKSSFAYMVKLEAYCNQLETDVKKLADIIEEQLALIESQLKIIELNPPDMELITDEETIMPDTEHMTNPIICEEAPYDRFDLWSRMWIGFKKWFKKDKEQFGSFDLY